MGAEWLAHRFDEAANLIRFVDYDRATRAAVPFLIDQYLPSRPFVALPRSEARQAAPAKAPVHFIFHSGFCCSTLLAACFDQPGLASSFSEPMILNDIVGWRKRGAPPQDVGVLLGEAIDLLARPFEGGEAAVVKPSTVVNGLARAIMHMRPESRAILIHAPLRDFLISIAKKGLDGRLWVRQLFSDMRREGLIQPLGFDDQALFGQTDLQIAAGTWLGQQALFARLAAEFPDRVGTVSSDRFLAEPASALRAAGRLFGLDFNDGNIDAAMTGPMRRNSKDGAAYTANSRKADYDNALAAHGDEIGKVEQWARAVAEAMGLPLELQHSLI